MRRLAVLLLAAETTLASAAPTVSFVAPDETSFVVLASGRQYVLRRGANWRVDPPAEEAALRKVAAAGSLPTEWAKLVDRGRKSALKSLGTGELSPETNGKRAVSFVFLPTGTTAVALAKGDAGWRATSTETANAVVRRLGAIPGGDWSRLVARVDAVGTAYFPLDRGYVAVRRASVPTSGTDTVPPASAAKPPARGATAGNAAPSNATSGRTTPSSPPSDPAPADTGWKAAVGGGVLVLAGAAAFVLWRRRGGSGEPGLVRAKLDPHEAQLIDTVRRERESHRAPLRPGQIESAMSLAYAEAPGLHDRIARLEGFERYAVEAGAHGEQIAGFQAQIAARDARIGSLVDEIARLDAERRKAQSERTALATAREAAVAEVARLQGEIVGIGRQLDPLLDRMKDVPAPPIANAAPAGRRGGAR